MTSPIRPKRPGGARPMPSAHSSAASMHGAHSLSYGQDLHAPLPQDELNGTRPSMPPRLSLNIRAPSPSSQPPQPSLDPVQLPPTQPLSLRPKLSLVYGDSAPAKPSRPRLGLSLSGSSSSSSLSLAIPSSSTPQLRMDDSPLDSYYNAGLLNQTANGRSNLSTSLFAPDTEPHSTETIRPPANTIMAPSGGPTASDPMDDLKKQIDQLILKDVNGDNEDEPTKWDDSMFEQIKRLGEGAGGAVYQVKHKGTGQLMAMKTIPANPETPVRQLHRELQFLSTCVHPNITKFYGAFLSSPSSSSADVHLLMEFCEGGSLEAVARKLRQSNRRIGEVVIAKLADGVLQGLDYLHGRKIIHRDIKPSNILLTREGIVKLCDFGVSGVLVNSMAGTFTGTSWYMAPERIRGDNYSIRSDVWSTGLTILELAQNRFPYPPDLGPIELLSYIVNGEVPELEDTPPGPDGEGGAVWSDGLRGFIKACLQVSATERPSPKEILTHPWLKQFQDRTIEMDKWMRQVWGWPKPQRTGPRRPRGTKHSLDDSGSAGGGAGPPESAS